MLCSNPALHTPEICRVYPHICGKIMLYLSGLPGTSVPLVLSGQQKHTTTSIPFAQQSDGSGAGAGLTCCTL